MTFLLTFFVALGLAFLVTPSVITLALKLGAVDVPTSRKVHEVPIPRLGGLSIILAVGVAIAFSGIAIGFTDVVPDGFSGMLAGLAIIVLLGLWDDVRNAGPLFKLFWQLVAAGLAAGLGVQFQLATNPFVAQVRDAFDLGLLAVPLTVLWIVFLTNAINLIDGLDGLATGISLFTSLTLFLICLNNQDPSAFLYIAIAGACTGFLHFNRYPAKVFLGDTGSMSLGFSLACLSVLSFQKSFTLSSFLIPFIVFGIPIFDSVLALARRYAQNREIVKADREHLHHRLMDLGLTQRQTVLLLYFVTILLGIIAFAFTVQLDEYAAVIVLVIGVVGAILAKELRLVGVQPRELDRKYKAESRSNRAGE